MKAIDAVKNLRALADLLEKHGDADIHMTHAVVWFNEKEPFLKVAKDFPRPFTKKYETGEYGYLILNHGSTTENCKLDIRIQRSAVCLLKEPARPAVYDCPSIFSEAEEAALTLNRHSCPRQRWKRDEKQMDDPRAS